MLRPLSRIIRRLTYYREWFLDAKAYLKSSTVLGYIHCHAGQQKESELTRLYHSLEKGLCMPDFHPRSGESTVRCLIAILADNETLQEMNAGQVAAARSVLHAYRARHDQLGVDVSDFCAGWTEDMPESSFRQWSPVSEKDATTFSRVMMSRKSIRNFKTDRIPDRPIIETAIRQAITSPSVCNRQTWRVHAFQGDKTQQLLALQSGNRGFGHTIPLLLIITSDMRSFTGAEERYQPWIEGGLFSMSLLLALHAQGLGAVALNWSVRNKVDLTLHQRAGIPAHERVILMIGCGFPVEGALVPASKRRDESSILDWNEPSC